MARSQPILAPSLLVAALALLGQGAQAQGLAPMVGASAIQGTLQSTSTPTYTGVLDRARTTVGTATNGTPNAAANGAPAGSARPVQAGPNLASGAPSGASVNGQPIPLCSHGGPCPGAMLRAMGRP